MLKQQERDKEKKTDKVNGEGKRKGDEGREGTCAVDFRKHLLYCLSCAIFIHFILQTIDQTEPKDENDSETVGEGREQKRDTKS